MNRQWVEVREYQQPAGTVWCAELAEENSRTGRSRIIGAITISERSLSRLRTRVCERWGALQVVQVSAQAAMLPFARSSGMLRGPAAEANSDRMEVDSMNSNKTLAPDDGGGAATVTTEAPGATPPATPKAKRKTPAKKAKAEGKAKAKGAGKAKAAKAAKEPKVAKEDTTVVKLLKVANEGNPFREGGPRSVGFGLLKDNMTVASFVAAAEKKGISRKDARTCLRHFRNVKLIQLRAA